MQLESKTHKDMCTGPISETLVTMTTGTHIQRLCYKKDVLVFREVKEHHWTMRKAPLRLSIGKVNS